jgi:peptide/nickel transport system permease protein
VSGYVVRRTLSGVAMVLALVFATFAVFSLIPFDPGHILVGPAPSSAQLRQADHVLGIDRPFYVQYVQFLRRLVLHGSLGRSFLGQPIDKIVADTAPVTIALVVGGAVLTLLLAIPLAILSARRPDSRIDRIVLAVSIVGIALHPFAVGALLRRGFGQSLHVLPASGYCPWHRLQRPPPTETFVSHWAVCHGAPVAWLWFSHLVLPWVTFALFFLPFYVRLIRARLLETYEEPFVLTARAKGASELRILGRHALRFVAGTVVTMAAFDVGASVTAAIYVEWVFGLHGLASEVLLALGTDPSEPGYDLPLMTGVVVVVATSVVTLNLLADLVASWLDPRIRLRAAAA